MPDLPFLLNTATLSFGENNLQVILSGWRNTVLLFFTAMALALIVGVPLGVVRSLPKQTFVSGVVRWYVEIFRSIPLIVQLFLWFFVLPELVPEQFGTWLKRGMPSPEYWNTALALGIYVSVRIVEITRAGIGSLGAGQREATHALGMSTYQSYRYVLLPQALRVVMPPITTEFANCFKATSVGLTIGYMELTQRAREVSELTFRTFEAFSVATLIYILSIVVIVWFLQLIDRSLRLPGGAT